MKKSLGRISRFAGNDKLAAGPVISNGVRDLSLIFFEGVLDELTHARRK
jgi:hypothetical protein